MMIQIDMTDEQKKHYNAAMEPLYLRFDANQVARDAELAEVRERHLRELAAERHEFERAALGAALVAVVVAAPR